MVNYTSEEFTSEKFFDNFEWMRTEEIAKYLCTSVGQIRNMVYRGQLKPRKFNRRLFFRKSEVDRAIESSRMEDRIVY